VHPKKRPPKKNNNARHPPHPSHPPIRPHPPIQPPVHRPVRPPERTAACGAMAVKLPHSYYWYKDAEEDANVEGPSAYSSIFRDACTDMRCGTYKPHNNHCLEDAKHAHVPHRHGHAVEARRHSY
jgi:hypothetical protein